MLVSPNEQTKNQPNKQTNKQQKNKDKLKLFTALKINICYLPAGRSV